MSLLLKLGRISFDATTQLGVLHAGQIDTLRLLVISASCPLSQIFPLKEVEEKPSPPVFFEEPCERFPSRGSQLHLLQH